MAEHIWVIQPEKCLNISESYSDINGYTYLSSALLEIDSLIWVLHWYNWITLSSDNIKEGDIFYENISGRDFFIKVFYNFVMLKWLRVLPFPDQMIRVLPFLA